MKSDICVEVEERCNAATHGKDVQILMGINKRGEREPELGYHIPQ